MCYWPVLRFFGWGVAVEFLVRAVTLYAWYVATVLVSLGVFLTVLYVVHHVRKWRQGRRSNDKMPDPGSPAITGSLTAVFQPGKLKIRSGRGGHSA
jgi:hypothetical protein